MFNLLKNLSFLYRNIISIGFMGEVNTGGEKVGDVPEELTEENKEQYLNDNKDKIISYIENLDADNNDKLSILDLNNNPTNINSVERILKTLNLDTYNLSSGIDISLIVDKINDFTLESREVTDDGKNQRLNLSSEVSSNISIEQKFSSLDSVEINNVLGGLEKPLDNSNNDSDKKSAQRTLQKLGYDISFTNRRGEKISGEAAVDGQLGNAFSGAITELQKDLGITQTGKLDQLTVDSIQDKLNNYVSNLQENNSGENLGLNEHYITNDNGEQILVRDLSETNGKTSEFTNSDMEITFGTGGEGNNLELRKNIDTGSFDRMINSMSFNELQELFLKIKDVADENNLNGEGGYSFRPGNIGEIKSVLQEAGYDIGFLSTGIEVGSVVSLFENIYHTQEKFNNGVDFKDRISVLLDHNQDGLIDNEVRFYTKEQQFLEAINSEESFENLLLNLGYSSMEEFNNSFNDNYYGARAEFKTRLASILSQENPLNPGSMLDSPDALKNYNEYRENLSGYENQVSESINEHELTKDLPEDTKAKIKLQAVGLILGSSNGIGANFDINEATDGLLDGLAFGVVNGVPGIGITKGLYASENGRISVGGGVVNFIPMVGVNGLLSEGEIREFDEMFPNKIDGSSDIVIGGGISPMGGAVSLGVNRLNEGTRAGIEGAKQEMSSVLDNVFEDIKSGKSFEQSRFAGNEQDRAIYERLSGMLEANGGYTQFLKEGALNNYERVLYENAGDGINLSSYGLGLAFVAGYFPIPVAFVGGESHDTSWNEVNTYSPSNFEGSEGYVESGFESNEALVSNLREYESAFSWKTRYNKGAVDFLTTSNDLQTRWEGLLRLSNGVGALKEVNLNSFLENVNTESDKWLTISTLSQYMKKAKDFDNGNIDSWNSKTQEFIATDTERRSGFNELLGFNADAEADEYYSRLEQSDNIGSTQIMGLGFDATASRNVEGTTVKGVDALYTNLSILTVDGEPLLIPVNDPAKIEGFKNMIANLDGITDELKQSIIDGIDNGSIELNFYKDPEGFDDRIIPIIPGGESSSVDVFQPNYETTNFGVAYVGEAREKDKDKPEEEEDDGIETEPGEDEEPIDEPDTPDELDTPDEPDTPDELDTPDEPNDGFTSTPGEEEEIIPDFDYTEPPRPSPSPINDTPKSGGGTTGGFGS